MTIGPEPMIMIFLMSVRFGIRLSNSAVAQSPNRLQPFPVTPARGDSRYAAISPSAPKHRQMSSRRPALPFGRRDLHFPWVRRHPFLRQVFPRGILSLDQLHPPFPAPGFNLFLATQSIVHVTKRFHVNQAMNPIPRGESRNASLPVFANPPHQAA